MDSLRSGDCPSRDVSAEQEGEEVDSNPETAKNAQPVARSEIVRPRKNERKSKLAMTLRCKLALQKTHKEFIRELDVMTTMDHLFAKMILTLEDTQRIKAMSTDYERRRTLLELLPSRGQGAYDELCESMSGDQPWIKDTLDRNYENITEDDLTEMEQTLLDLHTGRPTSTVAELRDALKLNMQDRLNDWKTALEKGVSTQEGLLPYINQPCSVKPAVFRRLLNSIEVVEDSSPGDRVIIYGEAGMGKTTLLKELARSWIEGYNSELKQKFTYVFFIPLRRVGQGTLSHIICDELKLVPVSCLEELKKSLELSEHRTLYLLDSYEELRGDVAKAKKSDIDDLITGRLFANSTVVVTSRPGSKLKRSKDQTTAHLEDLPAREVKTIIKHHFGGNKQAVDKVQKSFPAMSYLQKPINLALFIFIITQNKHLTLSFTQAELFSLLLQYIMLAFAKKKQLEEFDPQPGSYIANRDIPRDLRRLFSVIAKKCYEEMKQNDVLLHLENADDLKEYLDFGLFTAGADANTVVLPHRLFIEYFAAAHLAENPKVWATVFEEIKERSGEKSPRPLLTDVVRPMGLENVLRFLLALSPQPQLKQMCQQVGGLFVVEREPAGDDCDNYRLVNFKYYTELLRDCWNESGKRVLATALLNAPVRDIRLGLEDKEDRSPVLFPYLDYEQRVAFLKKIHNIELWVKDDKSKLSSTGDNNRFVITNADRFVVALAYQYGCVIKAEKLDIINLDLPASMFTRVSDVRQLSLDDCTMCQGLPDYLSDIDMSVASKHSSPSFLERVELIGFEGMEHCNVISSCECQLTIGLNPKERKQRAVRAAALKTCFPKISELKLYIETAEVYDHKFGVQTIVVYETEEELTSWLATVQAVRKLNLAPQNEGESLSLYRLLNIVHGMVGLEYLELHYLNVLLDARETSNIVKQNHTLNELWLVNCEGDVDLGQLLDVCSRQCPQLKKVYMLASDLTYDDKTIESAKQLPGLQRLTLDGSAVHTLEGRRPSWSEVRQHFHRLWPSAEIVIVDYGLLEVVRERTQQIRDDNEKKTRTLRS